MCLLHPTTSTSKLLDVVTCGYLLVFLLIIWLLHIFDCGGSVLTLLEKDTTVDRSLLHSKGSLYVSMDASYPRSFPLWKKSCALMKFKNLFVFLVSFSSTPQIPCFGLTNLYLFKFYIFITRKPKLWGRNIPYFSVKEGILTLLRYS